MISLAMLRRQFFSVRYNYTNPIERQQASGLLYLLWFIIVASTISFALQALPAIIDRGSVRFADGLLVVLPVITFLLGVGWLQTGRLRYTAILIFINLLGVALAALSLPDEISALMSITLIPVIFAGLIFEGRLFLIAMAVTFVSVVMVTVSKLGTFDDLFANLPILFGTLTILFAGAFFIIIGSATSKTITNLFDEVEQFHVLPKLVERISQDDDMDTLGAFTIALRMLRSELDYSFAQLYLVEDGRITRRFRSGFNIRQSGVLTDITIGDASALAEAAGLGKSVVISNADNVIRRTHFIASSHYGVALPVKSGQDVVAVIDIQTIDQPFTENRLLFLESFALQLGVLLYSLRTSSDLRQEIAAEEQIITGLRAQLREYRQAERLQVGSTWESYFEADGTSATGFDLADVQGQGVLLRASDLPDDLLQTMQRGEIAVETVGDEQVMRVPINVRGEVLGAMAFSFVKTYNITERQMELAQSVVNRLGLALENKRLFEQSQAQAIRERKANEVAGLLIGATAVEDVIALAAESFNQALGAVGTQIRLDTDSLTVGSDQKAIKRDNGDSTS